MKRRRVFSTSDMAQASRAIDAARRAGVEDENIHLIARSNIEMDQIPDDRKEVTSDVIPAALRGAETGGAIGLVAGIVAVAVPAIGITVAGAGFIALVGAMVGGWSSALVGSAVPNAVRRRFEREIEDGRILVIIDDDERRHVAIDRAIQNAGAEQLPFNELTAIS